MVDIRNGLPQTSKGERDQELGWVTALTSRDFAKGIDKFTIQREQPSHLILYET